MKNRNIFILIGILLVVFSIIVIALNTQTINYKERKVDDWYNDIMSGKQVITIYGASYCSHCQDYYPVISKIADKYKLNVYFFEIDLLKEKNIDDYEKLMYSFEINDFDGSVPFTYIMDNGDYKSSTTGYASRDNTLNYLKENGIIKD